MKKVLLTILITLTGHTALFSMNTQTGPVNINTTYNNARTVAFAIARNAVPLATITPAIQNDTKQTILNSLSDNLLQVFLSANNNQKIAHLNQTANQALLTSAGQKGFDTLIALDGFNQQEKAVILGGITTPTNHFLLIAQSTLYHATQADIQPILNSRASISQGKLAFIATGTVLGFEALQNRQSSIAYKLKENINADHILAACALAGTSYIIGLDNIYNHILQPTWNNLKQSYHQARQHPKEVIAGLLFALAANWGIRGDKSLVGQCKQNGIQEALPALADQVWATSIAAAHMCIPNKQKQPYQQQLNKAQSNESSAKNNNNIFQLVPNRMLQLTPKEEDCLWYASRAAAGASATAVAGATTFATYKGYKGYKAAKSMWQNSSIGTKFQGKGLKTAGAVTIATAGYQYLPKKKKQSAALKEKIVELEAKLKENNKKINSQSKKIKSQKDLLTAVPWIYQHDRIKSKV